MIQLPAGKLERMCRKEKCKAWAGRPRACVKRKKGRGTPAVAAEPEVPHPTAGRRQPRAVDIPP